jgi:hypothetical protein
MILHRAGGQHRSFVELAVAGGGHDPLHGFGRSGLGHRV